jgi:hypothetical protein
MARNRKHQTAAIRFGPALRAFLVCVVLGGSGVGYVWQKSQIVRLGEQVKEREGRLKKLEKGNEELRNSLALMHRPAWIDTRVKALNLGLVPVAPNQVLRLLEPAPEPVTPSPVTPSPGVTQYAAGRIPARAAQR